MRLSLQWKVLLSCLIIAGAGLGTAGWLALDTLQESDMAQLQVGLTAQARIAARLFTPPLAQTRPDSAAIDTVADDLGGAIHARVTVIAPDGVVLGDSYESGEALRRMDNHSTRPEVRQALTEGVGVSTRLSGTVGIRMLNLALPIQSAGSDTRLLGFVRLSLPLTEIEARHRTLRGLLVAALGGAFLLSLGLSYVVARSVTHPLGEMVAAARRMARGEFREKIHAHSNDEVADLGAVLNQMASSLDDTIRALTDDRAKMAATLTAMQEGVMVLTREGIIRLINPAMERTLGRREADVLGRPYLEVIRHPLLNDFLTRVLSRSIASATEITLRTDQERIFQVQASPLAQGADRSLGTVLAFHDITEIRRLEQVRKDFVANVSHELRTPLAAIKGYIEALQDGAYDDPEQRNRFLDTIGKHADRLNLIITDLLLLSKIESGQTPLKREPVALAEVVDRTMGLLRHRIAAKRHTMAVDIPKDLPPIVGDDERLGQIFSNLLENAIKYTPEEGTITLTATANDTVVEIVVEDTGIGIPPQDLPRIFERFYRVDKARSRELGGTGLGLSIVRHLVEGHGGAVWAESRGKGSRFVVRLPLAPSAATST